MSPRPKLASLSGPALRMQPDRRLARLAGEGDERAFEEIVRRYRPRLVAFAAAIVPAHHAEDIVQESLARVFTALQESDVEVHLRPWLYTIVRNRALNAVRDERVHVELSEEHDGVTPPPEILARREEVAALVAGIQALPEAQRQALVGRELEGLSHDEIAAQLGTSPGSVRGLIFRARTALRHAAGAIIPLPVIRWLLADAPASEAAGEAAAVGGLAAASAATAGAGGAGGGLAIKAGAIVVAAVLATGAGIGLRDGGEGSDGGRSGSAEASESDGGNGGQGESGEAAAPRSGEGSEGGQGSSSSRGPGSGADDPGRERDQGDDDRGEGGEGSSGPGDGDHHSDDHSGPGGGGGGDDDEGHGGHGGAEPDEDDRSGPGGGDDEHGGSSGHGSSGSGSGSGGSGSGGGVDEEEDEEADD